MGRPLENSNNALMSFRWFFFHDGSKFGGDETFGIGKPFGKLVVIKSNPPNFHLCMKLKFCTLDQFRLIYTYIKFKNNNHTLIWKLKQH